MNRFGGIQRLYGDQAFTMINNAHICVIGIGGVGSWAAEALARSSVGQITLIDMDDISHTNINRQLHALDSTVEQPKVTAMQARIKDIIQPVIAMLLISSLISIIWISCLMVAMTM